MFEENLFAAFIIASQRGLCMNNTEFAKALKVSRSTITRWKTTKSHPDRHAQLAIVFTVSTLMERKDAEMRQLIKKSGLKRPYHVTGTDNPIDFPKD